MNVKVYQLRSQIKDYFDLTKPRITLLVLITAYAGMWLAAGGVPPIDLSLVALLGIGLASASSCALNNYFDRDIDQLMQRTQHRALATGRLQPREGLWFGLMLNLAAFYILLVGVNALSAWLAVGTVFFYVVIYTLWLKRTSSLCTVIGGVAGALPPIIGWAAIANQIDWPAIVLFAILFFWQPPHFWALALNRTEDYQRANLPILPVSKGERATKRQILLYTVLLLPTSILLYWHDLVGELYLFNALVVGILYLVFTIFVVKSTTDSFKNMKRLFAFSILYLFLIFVFIFIDCRC